MVEYNKHDFIIDINDPILITGANGFIGCRVVKRLLERGFVNLKCFVRPAGNHRNLHRIIEETDKGTIEIIEGNLLSRSDCEKAVNSAMVIYHLAAGIEKSFPGCYMNSVVTTRNLLEAIVNLANVKRFVNVSSIAVYSNKDSARNRPLDETCEVDGQSHLRYEAYAYGKVKQDELLLDYATQFNIPYVIVRPGDVYGRGKKKIPGKVGIDTFGVFLHLGGSAKVPLTHVDNCAEAIVLSGLVKGVDGEIFNIIDNDLPTSRNYLSMYKKTVKQFNSIYLPYPIWYFLCFLWEKYSNWTDGQLPPAFNRRRCIAGWKRSEFTNKKIKERLNWKQRFTTQDALLDYFESLKEAEGHR